MTVTVAELRNELVDKHGWDRADADALKGKANLIAALEKSQQENPVDFDDLDVTVMHDKNTDVSSDDADSAPRS